MFSYLFVLFLAKIPGLPFSPIHKDGKLHSRNQDPPSLQTPGKAAALFTSWTMLIDLSVKNYELNKSVVNVLIKEDCHNEEVTSMQLKL